MAYPNSSTKTFPENLQDELNNANPNTIADVFRQMALGNMLSAVKVTVTSMTAVAAVPLTTPATFTGATVTIAGLPASTTAEGGDPGVSPTPFPAILVVRTLRVTASGTSGSVGAYIVTDAGGTAIVPPGGASAAVGVALMSDDGTTLTFPNTVTGFVLEYTPRSAVDLISTLFAPFTGQ